MLSQRWFLENVDPKLAVNEQVNSYSRGVRLREHFGLQLLKYKDYIRCGRSFSKW